MADQFAEIVFPVSLKQVFSYRVPRSLEGIVVPGMRCAVSFGRRNTIGLVTAITPRAQPM